MTESSKTVSVTSSYRMSDSLKNKIAEIMSSQKISADALFTMFISAYEKVNFGATSYGQAMSNDLDSWAMHSAALQQLYTSAIRMGMDAKDIATKELTKRIEASELAISGLQEKLNKAESDKRDMSEQLTATKQSLEAALKELSQAEQDAAEAKENASAWQKSITTLTNQIEANNEKAQKYDELQKKYNDLEAKLSAAQARNEVLDDLIKKYMTAK